jgi:hypothetical protein
MVKEEYFFKEFNFLVCNSQPLTQKQGAIGRDHLSLTLKVKKTFCKINLMLLLFGMQC